MSVKEKLALVGWLDPGKDVDRRKLAEFIRDQDGEVRYRAVERIGLDPSRETTDLLLRALGDPDELVRVQCLEELSNRRHLTRADALEMRPILQDSSELARRYAAMALAGAGDSSVIPLLKERLKVAPTAEQSSYCFALAKLGERAYLDSALELLDADCYQTRCSVANGIVDFVDDSNRERIVAALKKAWATETTRAARSSIEHALDEVEGRT